MTKFLWVVIAVSVLASSVFDFLEDLMEGTDMEELYWILSTCSYMLFAISLSMLALRQLW